jgi:hypothetical protein
LVLSRGETGSVVDITEALGDNVVGEPRGDVRERVDDTLAALAIDGGEDRGAAVVTGLVDPGTERGGGRGVGAVAG